MTRPEPKRGYRRFSDDFKLEVVNFAISHPELKLSEVASDFDVAPSSLRDWIKKLAYGKDRSHKAEEVTPDVKKIMKRNHELEMEVEILRRAMGILAKGVAPKGFTR